MTPTLDERIERVKELVNKSTLDGQARDWFVRTESDAYVIYRHTAPRSDDKVAWYYHGDGDYSDDDAKTIASIPEMLEIILALQERLRVSNEILDKELPLEIVKWEGSICCAYLNDHRIAGGKPWGGGSIVKAWTVSLRELARAIPALRDVLGLDYLGNPKKQATAPSPQKTEA